MKICKNQINFKFALKNNEKQKVEKKKNYKNANKKLNFFVHSLIIKY